MNFMINKHVIAVVLLPFQFLQSCDIFRLRIFASFLISLFVCLFVCVIQCIQMYMIVPSRREHYSIR